MSQFFQQPPNQPYGQSAQNLQFYPSSYTPGPVSGHATPSQAAYGYGAPASSPGYGNAGGFNSGFGGPAGVTGRMGEQGGLRTGWLAAFGTEGYDGEPPLLEELGVNFGHIQGKVLPLIQNLQTTYQCINLGQTLAVLNPLARIDQHIMDDSDLAGPVLFFLLFGTFLLFSGKVQPLSGPPPLEAVLGSPARVSGSRYSRVPHEAQSQNEKLLAHSEDYHRDAMGTAAPGITVF